MAKPQPAPSVVEAIALMQKARARGRGRRSPIMLWMQQNREALAAAFAQTAPAWSVLAAYLGERGITDGDGKPPSARSARNAWARVKALGAAALPRSPADSEIEGGSPLLDSDAGKTRAEPEPGLRRFRPVKLRGLDGRTAQSGATLPSANPSKPVSSNPEPGVDVDDLLSRFMPGATPRE